MPATRKQKQEPDGMRSSYDFSEGVRGKYAARFAQGSNVVVLAPDIAAVFKTSESVNAALRAHLARKPARKVRRRPVGRRV